MALEGRRLDKLEEVVSRSNQQPATLAYALRVCQQLVINRDFRQQVGGRVACVWCSRQNPLRPLCLWCDAAWAAWQFKVSLALHGCYIICRRSLALVLIAAHRYLSVSN